LTMPPSFQRGGDRSLNIGASAGHSQSPFASLPSHMPHLPVRFYLISRHLCSCNSFKILVWYWDTLSDLFLSSLSFII
jgi:hypothetical protein